MHYRKYVLSVCLILLLCPTIFAGKDDAGGQALAQTCDDCVYEITDVVRKFDLRQYNHQRSEHTFNVNSDGKTVTYLEFSFKIHHSHEGAILQGPPNIYPTYSWYDSDTWVEDDTITWYKFEIHGLNTVLDGSPFMDIEFHYKDPLPCRVPGDPLGLKFATDAGQGYLNQFDDDAGVHWVMGTETDGQLTYAVPNALLSVLQIGQATWSMVSQGVIGQQADLDIYLNNINFEYLAGYECTLQFHDDLVYNDVELTLWSANLYGTVDVDTVSSSRIVFSTQSLAKDYDFDGPLPLNTLFMTVTFDIKTTATPGTFPFVHISGDAVFSGCDDLEDISNTSTTIATIGVMAETATWKFPDGYNVIRNTQGFAYPFYIKSNCELETDNSGPISNAGFFFDTTGMTKVSYVGVSGNYNGMRWSDDELEGGIAVDESINNQSLSIPASESFVQMGFLTFNAEDVTGEEPIEFDAIEDDQHAAWGIDNYVVSAVTGNHIRYIDSIVGAVTYYGNLTLINGSIDLKNESGPSCPSLYTWHGSGFVLENPILTHSQGKVNPEPADDFYPFKYGIVEEEGRYKVEIRENANEITFLNQVELIVVDYQAQSKVGISNDGRVFTHQVQFAPIAAIDADGNDVLYQVVADDGIRYTAGGDGYLILSYPNKLDANQAHGFALDEPSPPKPKIKKGAFGYDEEALVAEIEDVDGYWHDLGAIQPRVFEGDNTKWFCDGTDFELGETIRVKISWIGEYSIDHQALEVDDGSYFAEHRLRPIEAWHSATGKVIGAVANTDEDIVTLVPGQTIAFEFDVPVGTGEKGYVRSFFFKSNGYYKTYEPGEELPTRYTLGDNYPNPFNPSTNIDLSLPVSGHVSLVVFNVLGQKVKTLQDGKMEAGNHQLMWGGDNDAGSTVASGVYFYRLKAGDFVQSKKMLLLK